MFDNDLNIINRRYANYCIFMAYGFAKDRFDMLTLKLYPALKAGMH